jgi:hypothetical protein
MEIQFSKYQGTGNDFVIIDNRDGSIALSNAQIAFSVYPTVRRIQRKLDKFTDEDYLLFIGDPTAIGIISAIAASKNNGRFKCLKWDKLEKRYIPIQVDLFPKKGEIDEFDEYI